MTVEHDPDGTMLDYTYGILYQEEEHHWWLASRREMVLDWVRRRYSGQPGITILDAGCGTGLMMREMQPLGEVHGVDISEEALRFCRQRGLDRVYRADLAELPFEPGTFDLVTAVDVIEHMENDLSAMREWNRVLKPGGRMVIFVPAHQWLWSLQDEISGHFRRYTRPSLASLVGASGMRVERITYVSTFLFPVIVLGRQWLKFKRRRQEVTTENTLHPTWANGILRRIFEAEIPTLRLGNFPFGASILCVAVKPGD